MNTAHNLAQLNIALMKEPADSPAMAEFMANIARINALAESSPGFVWRLADDLPGNPFGSTTLVNMSMWRDVAALSDFVHRSAHVEIMRRRREWFTRQAEASMVMWWVPAGHVPTIQEAHGRLLLLRQQGPTAAAFTFSSPFDPPASRIEAELDGRNGVDQPWSRQAVQALVERFEQCGVSKPEWTHEAHLVTGFWYVHTLGREAALERMRVAIRRHNEAVGTPNTDTGGYHETITRLFLRHMEEHIQRDADLPFESSLARLLASPMASSAWPLTFYTKERLFSVEARRGWVEPDLLQGER